jgi:hypothetical protein
MGLAIIDNKTETVDGKMVLAVADEKMDDAGDAQ